MMRGSEIAAQGGERGRVVETGGKRKGAILAPCVRYAAGLGLPAFLGHLLCTCHPDIGDRVLQNETKVKHIATKRSTNDVK